MHAFIFTVINRSDTDRSTTERTSPDKKGRSYASIILPFVRFSNTPGLILLLLFFITTLPHPSPSLAFPPSLLFTRYH